MACACHPRLAGEVNELMIGTTLSHYRITGKLGQGGMGEVWRAEDTKLGRGVALKMLPEDFANDPDRHARFEREAKVLASLNHPNIATLHALEHLDDQHVLVMELVEGEGLDEVIARGPVPIDETITMALQIAEALEAAHEAGIVHRDLKPANIRVRPDGTVKVLDFGLAKAWVAESGDSSLSMSPTMTKHATAAGVILGTAAYMSPEQARGKNVDRRADIWAFGVVLWEMLTGSKLFEGETVSDVLAAVLRDEPDLSVLPSEIPSSVRRLVTRCLSREPRQRLQWIGDARLELDSDPDESSAESTLPQSRPWIAWVIAIAGIAAGLIAVLWSLLLPGSPIAEPLHLEIAGAGFTSYSNTAISPDGKRVAYFSMDQDGLSRLKVRSIDTFDIHAIKGTEEGENPFFSPDGEWLAYLDPENRAVNKVSVDGGSVHKLPGVQISGYFNSGVWHTDGSIILSGAIVNGEQWPGLVLVPESGGEPQVLTTPEGDERRHYLPEDIPGTPRVLLTNAPQTGPFISEGARETGEQKLVLEDATTPGYLRSGRLFAFRTEHNDVVMVPFDARTATVVGQPVPVLSPVGSVTRGTGQYAVAENGTVVFNRSTTNDSGFLARDVVLVDRTGGFVEIEDIRTPSSWSQPRFSADGKRILLRRIMTPNCDLWTHDLERRTTTRITFEHDTHDPLWHSTGDEVLYAGDKGVRRAVFRTPDDGSRAPEVLLEAEVSMQPASWAAEGRRLALAVSNQASGDDVWVLDLDVSSDARPFLDSRFSERHPAFSPDGRWIAYSSDESGNREIFVRPYPGPGGRIQISNDGGAEPLWSPDGEELFYRANRKLMVVEVKKADGKFRTNTPMVLFDDPSETTTQATPDQRNYDISPDGTQFVMIHGQPKSAENEPLKIVVGWLQAVERDLEPQ